MNLAQILARKRADAAMPRPTVSMYVALFEASPRQLYLNYFSDYRILIDWLGLPVSTGEAGTICELLYNYEVQEIAKHLQVRPFEVWIVVMRNYIKANPDLLAERKIRSQEI